MNNNFVSDVAAAAVGRWSGIYQQLGINVPSNKNQHGPCPACGGKDRFRFDDKWGKGNYICSQCGNGDGLTLIAKINDCSFMEAARLVAPLVGITGGSPLTAEQKQDNQRKAKELDDHQRRNEKEENHQKKMLARRLWETGVPPQPDSAYLQKKRIGAYGLKGTSKTETLGGHTFAPGSLILPLHMASGELVAAQVIDSEQKIFVAKTKDTFHIIGQPETSPDLWIAEGYATAASVHEALSQPVVIALSANALTGVAKIICQRHPDKNIYFAADHDQSGTGEKEALKAAQAVGGYVILPAFDDDTFGDWNDYAARYGLEATREAIKQEISNTLTHQFTDTTSTNIAQRGDIVDVSSGTGSSSTCTEPVPPDSKNTMQENNVSEIDPLMTIASRQLVSPEIDLKRLQALNERLTHVVVGGRHMVVSLKPCHVNGESYIFEKIQEFKNYFLHEPRVKVRDSDNGKTAALGLGDTWLQWHGKAFCPDGVGYYPTPEKCPTKVFNMYGGLAVIPREGDCSVWLQHLRDVICGGREVEFNYALQWFAHLIQKPDEKPSVAIVLKSCEGAGKGALVEPVMRILGAHGVHVNGTGQIAGRFNSTLANKQLVFIDEANATDRGAADTLKGIISEPTINLERKGLDPEPMPNYTRLIFASNLNQVLSAGMRERRYLVLEPNEANAQDPAYFNRYWNWVNNQNGPSRLLHLLQITSLEGFDPRRCPTTSALLSEQLVSMSPINQFLHEQISKVEPFLGKTRIPVTDLINDFIDWCEKRSFNVNRQQAQSLVGKQFYRMEISGNGRSGRGNGKYYELPGADELRKKFSAAMGAAAEDVF
jgi:putative DNA primase/helicase